MSINVKKYTKDQMAKMVEEAQEAREHAELTAAMYISDITDLKVKNAALTERISQMNGEAINRANEIANLKADADVLRNKLADTEAALGRANDELTFKGAALNVMHKLNVTRDERYNAEQRTNYAEAHPWRNLLAWLKRKLKMA